MTTDIDDDAETSESLDQSVYHRISRYDHLHELPHLTMAGLPPEALDLLYARTIMPVISEGDTAVAAGAPIRGAGGLALGFAVCPPGQGPSLHRHSETFETFVVLDGAFEYSWGVDGEHSATLRKHDVISFPPGVFRAFRAVSDTDAMMLAVINGPDQEDITIAPSVAVELESLGCRDRVAALGFRFDT